MIRRALEDPARDKLGQAIGEDVPRHSKACLELFEMLEPVECSAKDEERPFLADNLDRRRNWARQRGFLEGVNLGRHPVCRQTRRLPLSSCDESITRKQRIVASRNLKC